MTKVLIIDDEKIIRERLQKLLDMDDYETITAGNGDEGLAAFDREKPEIALVDMKMPGMDGMEVLKKIRECSDYSEVIIITGHGEIETAIEAIKNGAFDYISKPIDYDQLIIDIERAVERQNIQKKLDCYVEELKTAKIKAEESDQLKSVFLATMSHEIRTPLSTILGFTELISLTDLDDKQKQYIQYIKNSGSLLLTIIDDILDLSKIESGLMSLNPSPGSIHATFDIIMSNADMMIRHAGKKIALRKKIDDDISEYIICDISRIQQVLNNLLSNAVKFTEKGLIEFGARLRDEKTVLFYVKDTGPGIEQQYQDKIFDSFRKGGLEAIIKYKGTGIGLTISRKLVELMGGSIWFESNKGDEQGTIFYFTHPYIPVKIETREFSGRLKEKGMKKYHVLVVEDDVLEQALVQQVLQSMGFSISIAGNGQDAIDTYNSDSSIDLVLMDIQMPILGGLDATKEIRRIENEDPHRKRVPIIALTAAVMRGDKELCLESGCDDYISKPIEMDIIYSTMMKYLE